MICMVEVKIVPLRAFKASTGGWGDGGKNRELPILDSGFRRRRVVSATPKPFYFRERGRVPILQEAGYVRKTSPPPRL
jgi:hypothetical protein